MNEQRKLDFTNSDICENNHGGNAESIEAHESMKHTKAQQRRKIMSFIRECGKRGATAYEVEVALGMINQSVTARCSELKAKKEAIPSGIKRPTQTGRMAMVLLAPEFYEGEQHGNN